MKRASTMTALLLALSTAATTSGDDASYKQVSRSAYFSRFADYAACRAARHTPLGGKPFVGDVVVASRVSGSGGADIATDPAAGIDASIEQDVRRAIADGIAGNSVHRNGATPEVACTKVTTQNTAALWDYIQTVEPVSHPVTSNRLPLPFN
jgi:hypothetical protein